MSSHDMKNPTGGVNMRHVIESPDPNSNLMEQVLSRHNIQLAWKRVKSNKGAPGVDSISIEKFPDSIRERWESIWGKKGTGLKLRVSSLSGTRIDRRSVFGL